MKPVRVLQIVGAMNRGGVETWLKHVVSNTDRREVTIDFLVHTQKRAAYDDELEAMGAKIYRCPHTRNPLRYAREFLGIVKYGGPYDVLHSHVQCFSGYSLALGRTAGIPVRIAHSHNDTSLLDAQSSVARKLYRTTARNLIAANCTHGFAVSAPAAAALFGPRWRSDDRLRVLYCGIDLKEFRKDVLKGIRSEFGFAPDDIVFGHVGRFDPQKNHSFFVELAAEITRREPRARFLLVGDGPLRAAAEAQAAAAGLNGKMVFAGLRPDIPRLMTGAMDVFLFPSLHEGLPLVLMETQAAGLTAIASTGSPEETVVIPELVKRVPLAAGVGEWARLALETAGQPRFDRVTALNRMEAGRFSINRGLQHLVAAYRDGTRIAAEQTRAQRAAAIGENHG
jgi:glycosyltransferase involved in cell wall biosynthesis